MSIEKWFRMIFWYVMINVGNAFGKNANTGNKNISWWKRFTKGYSMLINLRKLIHPAKINMVFIKIWKLKTNFGTWSAPVSLTRAVPWNSMEIHGTWSEPISLTRAIPWNSMELGVCQFRWHEQFHGITCKSMELGVCQFRWHEQLHSIPWNLECANFADTGSSIEFHGTWGVPISMTRAVPWNSMEIHGTWSVPISLTRAVPFNSMELGVRQCRWHE